MVSSIRLALKCLRLKVFFRFSEKPYAGFKDTLSMYVYSYSYKWSLDQSVNVWSDYFPPGNGQELKTVTNTGGSGIG